MAGGRFASVSNGLADGLEPTKSRRIFLALRDLITRGEYVYGDRLPGELKLAEIHGVSRVTVRRALSQLKRAGLIDRHPGSGTVVTFRPHARPVVADFSNMLANLMEMGRSSDVRLLAFGYGLPPAGIQRALRLPDGARTQQSVRVRLVDGAPFSYLVTHVPEAIGATYTEAELAATPLLALLERSGVVADHATQTITATVSTPETAEALDVAVGDPLLALTRVVYDPDGKGVEHLAAYYRPDRYTFQMTLARVSANGVRQWSPITPAGADGGPNDKSTTQRGD